MDDISADKRGYMQWEARTIVVDNVVVTIQLCALGARCDMTSPEFVQVVRTMADAAAAAAQAACPGGSL